MPSFIQNFCADEDGAVTVDWVVLTAAIVGLAIAVTGIIFPVAETIASNTDTALAQVTLDTDADGD